jgi:hypothetical protein
MQDRAGIAAAGVRGCRRDRRRPDVGRPQPAAPSLLAVPTHLDGYRDCYLDLVLPQQQADQQGLAPATWKPRFYDYLYVSLTSSIAFSPTDAMPYSRWAKLSMGVQSIVSFSILARVVNIAR